MSTKPKEWTVLSMLEWTTDYFKQKGIPNPRLSIEWLLAETLEVKRLDLYLKFDRPLSQKELEKLRPLIKRRARHEPLQYIVGYTDFMTARISVSPDVLIPRIETEQLVETILDNHSEQKKYSAIDLGTGSGCIPIALKMKKPDWYIKGIDISEDALELARQNAESNEVEIDFQTGDILNWQNLEPERSYDLVVSNPPYVLPEDKQYLEKQVIEYEPSLALFCDNLKKMYNNIIDFSEEKLKNEGWLYLEIHEEYSELINSLFDKNMWAATIEKDYQQKPRFVFAQKRF